MRTLEETRFAFLPLAGDKVDDATRSLDHCLGFVKGQAFILFGDEAEEPSPQEANGSEAIFSTILQPEHRITSSGALHKQAKALQQEAEVLRQEAEDVSDSEERVVELRSGCAARRGGGTATRGGGTTTNSGRAFSAGRSGVVADLAEQ